MLTTPTSLSLSHIVFTPKQLLSHGCRYHQDNRIVDSDTQRHKRPCRHRRGRHHRRHHNIRLHRLRRHRPSLDQQQPLPTATIHTNISTRQDRTAQQTPTHIHINNSTSTQVNPPTSHFSICYIHLQFQFFHAHTLIVIPTSVTLASTLPALPISDTLNWTGPLSTSTTQYPQSQL